MYGVLQTLALSLVLVTSYLCLEVSAAGCSGLRRVLLTELEGTITDGPGFYDANVHCEWLIEAPDPNMTITLTFTEFETECTYDFLTVFDGNTFTSPVLGAYSGNLIPGPVQATSGKMLIHLYSDTNYPLNGTTASYQIQNCSKDCSGHGVCENYKCACDTGYKGDACELKACPLECGSAHNRGRCDFTLLEPKCVCSRGFVGEGCALSTDNNTGWGDTVLVSSGTGTVFTARTGHRAEYHDTTDCLWVFGGFNLNGVLEDLVRYNFTANQWERVTSASGLKPAGRYAHSMVLYDNELIVFGGILADGSMTNDLWSFDLLTLRWSLLTPGSDPALIPPGLADHSGTIVDFSHLFIFGGRSENTNFEDGIFKYDLILRSGWDVVLPIGGREADVRVRGHSAVYHLDSESLIVFGGFRPSSTRFSERSNKTYAFQVQKRYWMKWEVDISGAPMGRAFHSANILGNYMVVYGGNVHKHYTNSALHEPLPHERCYDDKIELFHLGCHAWVDFDTVAKDFKSPSATYVHTVTRGRFGHAAAVRDGSTLLIVGGFSGRVLKDLIAVRMPGTLAVNSKLGGSVVQHCPVHSAISSCESDPNCGWCAADNTCLGHSQQNSCTEPQGFISGVCPGVCNSLVTCESCIVWGKGVTASDPAGSRVNEQCGWCIQERQCYPLGEPGGLCADQSSSLDPVGWWGHNGTFLAAFSQCRLLDRPPGLTWIKYRHPQNTSQPDEVTIVEATDESFSLHYVGSKEEERTNGGEYIAEFKGFLRPNGAVPTGSAALRVWMGSSHAISTLYLSSDDNPLNAERVAYASHEDEQLVEAERDGGATPLFPDTSEGAVYYVLQEERQVIKLGEVLSVMDLKWNGNVKDGPIPLPFTREYLQPYFSSSCDGYVTCSACLTDAACGWCPASGTCELRDGPMVSVDRCGTAAGTVIHHLILDWDQCLDCKLYVDCLSCTANPLCEWLLVGDDISCTRRGRFPYSVTDPSQCTLDCHEYTNCSDCSKRTKECAWCEVTQTCFTFGTFVTSFTYGQCPNWFDFNKACPSCSAHTDCKSCLASFQCGWCGNRNNPTLGSCQEGNFGGPIVDLTCNALVAGQYNLSASEPADWSYSVCPDVQECLLGLDECHANATCANTFDAYECTCHRGFEGNGRDRCDKTCYHECVHGQCSGAPDYTCICDIGWTGENCSADCECNFHSTCTTGIGICDECQHWAMGDYCELCRPGSYGNATDPSLGCLECQCHGHGDAAAGHCHNQTGVCFCTENTEGDHCENCVDGFYHDAKFPQHCSRECSGRMLLTNVGAAALGSGQGQGVASLSSAYCLWVLTAGDNLTHTAAMTDPPSISLTVEGIQTLCGSDYVYVYDGIPEYLSMSHPGNAGMQLAALCGQDPLEPVSTVAHSGTMTVVFQANLTVSDEAPGFVASYSAGRCPDDCRGNRQCVQGKCGCLPGYRGPDCQAVACPLNCSTADGQGTCDEDMGVCDCRDGYGGDACQYPVSPLAALKHGVWSLLADEARLDPDASATAGAVPCGRIGHTLVAGNNDMLWLYGGYSHAHGDLSDIWSYDLATKQWTQHFSDSPAQPAARHFHAATFYSPHLMISGGMNQTDVLGDVWFFNTVRENWSQIPAEFPQLAGHSFTKVKEESLVVVGGYSPTDGLQPHVLEFSNGQWLAAPTSGTPPTGLFGHSTVWHPDTQALYVYGGYRFHLDSMSVSDRLYSISYQGDSKLWSVLPPEPTNQQLPHIFHTAVTMADYMLVIGGGTSAHNFSSTLLAYHYDCNQWQTLTDFTVGSPPSPSSSLAAVVASDGNVYTFGGNDGTALGALHRLSLPPDLCPLQTTADGCRATLGCAACVETNQTQQLLFCKSNADVDPASCSGMYSLEQGVVCNDKRVETRTCRAATSCSDCVMTQPAHSTATQVCKWCANCPDGACIDHQLSCVEEHNCQVVSQKEIIVSSQCPELNCEASDCHKCVDGNECIWTQQFKRASEIRRLLNPNPTYDWNCFSAALLDIAPTAIRISSSPTEPCPALCHTHASCEACLDSRGADGGWRECVWSSRLTKCFSPTYLPLVCSNGACGPLTRYGSDNCPRPCYLHAQCAHCLQQPGCGWCAVGRGNGTGVCMEGGLYEPTGGMCAASGVDLYDFPLEVVVTLTPEDLSHPPSWNFITCPPENECLNGHHDCQQNEECNDTLTSYECNCKLGYKQQSEGAMCRPVCTPECQYGTCVEPDTCLCDFGYVGADCGVMCECNGHSTCAGPQPGNRTICLECMNNTQGKSCDKCLPLYVGDPIDGGQCLSCLDHCNGNSGICLSEQNFNISRDLGLSLDLRNVALYYPTGPVSEAVCADCANFSAGQTCETCVDGYFKDGNACRLCQCNGHWDSCDKSNGEDCQCRNNTDTPSCPTEKYPSPCWQHQCSICKELFTGTPTDGRQCYRQMHVDQDTCFDPETQTNCPLDSAPLLPGRTSFFVVQPKFTNLDIRLTVDVTVGGLDVYLTYSPDFFTVLTNQTTGRQAVELGEANLYAEAYRGRRDAGPQRERRTAAQELIAPAGEQAVTPSAEPPVYNTLVEYAADGRVNTFVTVADPHFVAVVRGLRNRLVVTLPQDVHELKTRKFYIALLSRGADAGTGADAGADADADDSRGVVASDAANGIMYFRQDQPHIDLFVFFSVFLSCFFLFLAILVVAWKVKVGLEARHDRMRRALELEHRVSRPIGRVLLYLQGVTPGTWATPVGTTSAAAATRRHARLKKGAAEVTPGSRPTSPCGKSFNAGIIACEPTEDDHAAVGTTIISLPGGDHAPVQACLGSALILMKSSTRLPEPPQAQQRPIRFSSSGKPGICREMRM